MANITKIFLGLTILAGGAGIFFGITKFGQASELGEKAKTAETKATAAVEKMTKLEDEKKKLVGDLSIKTQEAVGLRTTLETATKNATANTGKLTALQKKNLKLTTDKKSLETLNGNLQERANEATLAQDDLRNAETEIEDLRTKLAKHKAPKKSNTTKQLKVGDDGIVGKIANVDPRTGSLILNRGSAHGFKVGDEYNVWRNDTVIGRIKVTRLSSNNTGLSSAQRVRGATGVPAGLEFQVNDDLFTIP